MQGWEAIRAEVLRRIRAREWLPGGLIPGEEALSQAQRILKWEVLVQKYLNCSLKKIINRLLSGVIICQVLREVLQVSHSLQQNAQLQEYI